MVDDYELLPHEELENLRKEVERLKKSPFPDSKQNKTLLESMDALTTSINKLIKIFEGAQEDIIKEYSESSPTKILKQISEQNAKIAEGIVALADMVKKGAPKTPGVAPPTAVPPSFTTPTSTTPPTKPGPKGNLGMPDLDSQDLDLKKKKRKGLFSAFKK